MVKIFVYGLAISKTDATLLFNDILIKNQKQNMELIKIL